MKKGKHCNRCDGELKTIMRVGGSQFYYCTNNLCPYFALLQIPKTRIIKQAISMMEIE